LGKKKTETGLNSTVSATNLEPVRSFADPHMFRI
jgi:hypothetical protein